MSYNKIIYAQTNRQRKVYFKDKGCTILHREDGPAIEYVDGTREWWVNGKRHRKGAPAIEYDNGDKEWFVNGIYHREDGPAIIWEPDYIVYYLNGQCYEEQEYWSKVRFGGFV